MLIRYLAAASDLLFCASAAKAQRQGMSAIYHATWQVIVKAGNVPKHLGQITIGAFVALFLSASLSQAIEPGSIDEAQHCDDLRRILVERGLLDTGLLQEYAQKSLDICEDALAGNAASQVALGDIFNRFANREFFIQERIAWLDRSPDRKKLSAQFVRIMPPTKFDDLSYEGLWQRRLYWWRKAAQQDLPLALHKMSRPGTGSDDERLAFLMRAVEANYSPAIFDLSEYHRLGGLDVEIDREKSKQLRLLAAELGNGDAAVLIGRWMMDENPEEGLAWYKKGADWGYPGAQYAYGWSIGGGHHGAKKDMSVFIDYMQRAATGGHTFAQFVLGTHYSSGKYLPKDDRMAEFWIIQAAEQGEFGAMEWLDKRLKVQNESQASSRGKIAGAIIGVGLATIALAVLFQGDPSKSSSSASNWNEPDEPCTFGFVRVGPGPNGCIEW